MIQLEKPKGKIRVEIVTDEKDDYLLYVRRIEKSTNKLKESSMIIQRDLSTWLTHFKNMGWIIV